jgi:hypothetical protein
VRQRTGNRLRRVEGLNIVSCSAYATEICHAHDLCSNMGKPVAFPPIMR